MPSDVIHIQGKFHLESILNQGKKSIVVLDFSAPWCGPCQRIAPLYHEMPKQFPNVFFLGVDTEQMDNKRDQIHANFGVRAFPTFVFLSNGNEVERFSGANIQKVHETVVRLIQKHDDDAMAEAIRQSLEASNSISKAPPSEEIKDDPEPTNGNMLIVKIKRISSEDLEISINENAQIQHLRRRVAATAGTSQDLIRLIFKGKILSDGSTLKSYGINESGYTIHMAISGASATKAQTSPNSNDGTPSTLLDSSVTNASVNSLRRLVQKMETVHGKDKAKDAVQLMSLYIRNIIQFPDDVKYRSIRMGNSKFASKIGCLEEGMNCMKEIGFDISQREGESYLVLKAGISSDTMKKYRDVLDHFHEALVTGATATSTSSTAPPATTTPAAAGFNPFGSFPSPGNQFPAAFPGTVSPDMLAAMQSDPLVQNLSRQMTERLMQNPEMMQEMMRAMTSGQDPMTALMANPQTTQFLMSLLADGMPNPGESSGFAQSPFQMGGMFLPPSVASGASPNSINTNNTSATQNRQSNTENEDDFDDLDDIYADES